MVGWDGELTSMGGGSYRSAVAFEESLPMLVFSSLLFSSLLFSGVGEPGWSF
jgi:hypothetical protein